jgi:predicted Ser/Thr protein kinase
MQSLQQLISGQLVGSKSLKLSCSLTKFPEEIFSLSETLEILDLSVNQLSELPEDFGKLSKLKIVFFSENKFTKLPEVLSNCKQLSMIGFKSNQLVEIPENSLPKTTRWLILTNNQITKLPSSIGNCNALQKVALAGNCLKELPEEMANCRNLELLRISANQFFNLPDWLFQLPKLSWLAFSGNPFCPIPKNLNHLQAIAWEDFELSELLGEGASGHIYKAIWKNNSSRKQVAIKVFKGEVTSDGLPDDEMRATLAAGIQQHLVPLIGEIKNHPKGKQGLVMDLIPPSYFNLGLPPSFETCTRDTFKEGTFFPLLHILKIVRAVTITTKHLHDLGINHGDLYAHNILIDKDANTLMGDFGAATFFNHEESYSQSLQKIESRALGCLIDDLLRLVKEEEKSDDTYKVLVRLRDNLMISNFSKRYNVIQAQEFLEKMER